MNYVNPFSSTKSISKVQCGIAIALWGFIIYRAFALEMTVDESYTYYLVKTNDWRLLPRTANTHWLTSFFAKVFLKLPGADREWKIRLFSVLCWPFFVYSIISAATLFKRKWLGFAFFFICIVNPYLVMFFSLARGYAPACTFVSFSLLLIFRDLLYNKFNPQKWLLVFLFASVAVLANFSFFYLYISLAAIFFTHLFLNKEIKFLKTKFGKLLLALVALTFIFSAASLSLIKQSGDLYYGGQDLINSLINSLITGINRNQETRIALLAPVIFYCIIGIFLFSVYDYFKTRTLKIYTVSIGICVGIILLNFIFHTLFGTPYLLSRTALVLLVPAFVGILSFLDDIKIYEGFINVVTAVISCILIFLFSLNIYRGTDLVVFYEWPTDLKRNLDVLIQLKARKVGMSVSYKQIFGHYYAMAFHDKYPFNVSVVETDVIDHKPQTLLTDGYEYLVWDFTGTNNRYMNSLPVIQESPPATANTKLVRVQNNLY